MLNLLAKLKNDRHLSKSRGGIWVVFLAFAVGALLFFAYGSEAFRALADELSNMRFFAAYTAIFAFLMLAAFSQLGQLLVILTDTVFEFFALLFSTERILNINANFSFNAVLALAVLIFAFTAVTLSFSERALALSTELTRRTAGDKRYFASISASFFLYLAVLIILVIICITAF